MSATTHQEVVKVWIAPGCIVCDACENDCPEVFDVQEDTCIIKPDALKAEFTKPLTASIKVAAEGCPVDVIKFETIEVEGPDPWAGKEPATAGAAKGADHGSAKGPAKSAGWSPPEGPPDPAWAKLLTNAATTGRHGPTGKDPQAPKVPAGPKSPAPAKAPADAIVASLPDNAPPDALNATMIATGYLRPRPGATHRIRRRASAAASTLKDMTRRQADIALALGWGILALIGTQIPAVVQSFMIPRLTKEPPSKFRAGKLSDYPTPGVYEAFKGSMGVWIVHMNDGSLAAVSTTCTHLGCIPNWLPSDQKFKCPCHGSGFTMEGINFEGPAPRPLERLAITLDGDAVLVDKSTKFRQELGQWNRTNFPESSLLL